ncbi:MAG: hypothetical protein JO121_30080 [Deltaproteobacteria bacterium]|nr:hypothetical protein [Deltaproteobacteria bacterium]
MRLTPVVVVDAHEVRIKAHRPRREGIRSGSYRAIVHVPPLEISRLREPLARVAFAPPPLPALGERRN